MHWVSADLRGGRKRFRAAGKLFHARDRDEALAGF